MVADKKKTFLALERMVKGSFAGPSQGELICDNSS